MHVNHNHWTSTWKIKKSQEHHKNSNNNMINKNLMLENFQTRSIYESRLQFASHWLEAEASVLPKRRCAKPGLAAEKCEYLHFNWHIYFIGFNKRWEVSEAKRHSWSAWNTIAAMKSVRAQNKQRLLNQVLRIDAVPIWIHCK